MLMHVDPDRLINAEICGTGLGQDENAVVS